MKPSIATALFALLVAALPACAQLAPAPPALAPPKEAWRVAAGGAPAAEAVAAGLTYSRIFLDRPSPEGAALATLHLLRFESSRCAFKVIDQGDAKPGRYRSLAEAMRANGCIAGCNGGFFHPDFRPSGLVVADGRRINRFENAKLLSGLIVVDRKGPRLLRRAEFEDSPGVSQLLQAGPFLVDRGQSVAGLSASPSRARTFVATDAKGGWAIGLCTSASLADLGNILADPALTGGFNISRALNLDGGSSSALYFERAAGAAPFHRDSFTSVRNFLGIVRF